MTRHPRRGDACPVRVGLANRTAPRAAPQPCPAPRQQASRLERGTQPPPPPRHAPSASTRQTTRRPRRGDAYPAQEGLANRVAPRAAPQPCPAPQQQACQLEGGTQPQPPPRHALVAGTGQTTKRPRSGDACPAQAGLAHRTAPRAAPQPCPAPQQQARQLERGRQPPPETHRAPLADAMRTAAHPQRSFVCQSALGRFADGRSRSGSRWRDPAPQQQAPACKTWQLPGPRFEALAKTAAGDVSGPCPQRHTHARTPARPRCPAPQQQAPSQERGWCQGSTTVHANRAASSNSPSRQRPRRLAQSPHVGLQNSSTARGEMPAVASMPP